jgi:hypothetical protein
MIYQ